MDYAPGATLAQGSHKAVGVKIMVYAIEVKEVRTVSDKVSKVLLDRIPEIVEEIVQDMQSPGQ